MDGNCTSDFEVRPGPRLVVGPGSIDRLGRLSRELAGSRALVVSDPGIVEAGHTAGAIESLTEAGVATAVFGAFGENPTADHVEAGAALAREFRPDLLVGLGGGSSMDCAKGINFLFSCGGRMQDYRGRDSTRAPMLPSIAVPTTAGTGSEAQSYALIANARTHMKMACGDPKAACRIALLDPELTLSMPQAVTAAVKLP
jgi:alcohol dehydrogenase